jgi:hypothetical protein
MAKTKSSTGGKTRKTVNREQTPGTAPVSIPEVSATPNPTTPAQASEAKLTPETKATPAPNPTPAIKSSPESKITQAANPPELKSAAPKFAEANAAPEAKITPEPRKFEVVKTEPRKNVVPINRTPVNLEEEIRRRAYEIYQQRGGAPGSEMEDWLNAEREVRKRYQQQSA